MRWHCIVCEKIMIPEHEGGLDPACWPNIEGGTMAIDFGYGSKYDDNNGYQGCCFEWQSCICDECFDKKKHLCRHVEIIDKKQWKIVPNGDIK